MVKKNPKISRLEKALDDTLDRFLEKVTVEEVEKKEEAQKPVFTSGEGKTVILSPDLEKRLLKLGQEKNKTITDLLKEIVSDYFQGKERPLDKEKIKGEIFSLKEKLEVLDKGEGKSDLSSKERKVLLSYFRQLARGNWEDS